MFNSATQVGYQFFNQFYLFFWTCVAVFYFAKQFNPLFLISMFYLNFKLIKQSCMKLQMLSRAILCEQNQCREKKSKLETGTNEACSGISSCMHFVCFCPNDFSKVFLTIRMCYLCKMTIPLPICLQPCWDINKRFVNFFAILIVASAINKLNFANWFAWNFSFTFKFYKDICFEVIIFKNRYNILLVFDGFRNFRLHCWHIPACKFDCLEMIIRPNNLGLLNQEKDLSITCRFFTF